MNHTVAVVIGGTELATGVVVSVDDQAYIVTARHVVEGAHEVDLRFIFRPPGTFQHVPRSTEIRQMLGRRFTELPIERIDLSSDEDDLALLEIASYVVDEHRVIPHAFEMGAATPLAGEQVFVVGFPFDIAKGVTSRTGEPGIGVLPLAYVTEVHKANFEHEKYHPEAHFLLTFDPASDDVEVKKPKGMSGGGVWMPPGFQGPASIWSPERVNLVGIQIGWFEDEQTAEGCQNRATRNLALTSARKR